MVMVVVPLQLGRVEGWDILAAMKVLAYAASGIALGLNGNIPVTEKTLYIRCCHAGPPGLREKFGECSLGHEMICSL